MKKFIIASLVVVVVLFLADTLYYRMGVYIDFHRDRQPVSFTAVKGKAIYLDQGDGQKPFEIRGVNMGVGIPGRFATDYAIDKQTYLRWFRYIKEMGANTLRVYTILDDTFYNAFYEYNDKNPDPLYLIHGVWVNDYVQNSHRDAYDDAFLKAFEEDCRTVVDIIHGKRKLSLGKGLGSGSYFKDVSPWVIGYILGVEWEDVTVAYTDHKLPQNSSYQGQYMYTAPEATAFEAMLARVGDKIIEYESKRYKAQRLVAFSNWPTTDPFDYPEQVADYFLKFAKVDAENIKTTESFLSGQFASYHIYPYYPDFLNYFDNADEFVDKQGKKNTYFAYLKMINQYHSMPVVISEFGVSSARGMAQRDQNTGRNQGGMSESEQGQAIADSYRDIKDAGCAGSIVFTWQDEWFKRTWNTMHAVDLLKTPYWSDYQTNEQYFGLLSFDPGEKESVCYVDGDTGEWSERDLVWEREDMALSMKYDEKFLYFLVRKEGFDPEKERLYLPIDTTPKTGSNFSRAPKAKFDREADFLVVIDGKENSRVLVQERYDVLRAMYSHETRNQDAFQFPPDKNTPDFKPVNLMLQTATPLLFHDHMAVAEVYETGKLTYGNANPKAPDFNSLADYSFNVDCVEIKLPWQLLNFSNPSEMKIHDDYYRHYGVEEIQIDRLYAGVGDDGAGERRIVMAPFELKGWGRNVTYHERLKSSYYILRRLWRDGKEGGGR